MNRSQRFCLRDTNLDFPIGVIVSVALLLIYAMNSKGGVVVPTEPASINAFWRLIPPLAVAPWHLVI